jgi:hypothetical protein
MTQGPPQDNPEAPKRAAGETPATREGKMPSTLPSVRKIWSHGRLIIILAVACAVMAALIAHTYLQGPGLAPVNRPAARTYRPAPPRPLPGASQPTDLLGDWMTDAGLEKLKQLPPEAVAPEGAELKSAFRHATPDGPVETVLYEAAGDVDSARQFYETRLPQQGYSLLTRGRGLGGTGVTLNFRRPGRACVVKLDLQDELVMISIVLEPMVAER